MTTYTEPTRPLEFLASEANGARSREAVALVEGLSLEPGTVLARLTADGAYTALNPAADPADGSETAAAVLGYPVDGDTSALAFVRDCEVITAALAWPEGITAEQKSAAVTQLADVGIIAR